MPEKTIKRRLQDCDAALASDDRPIFSTVAKLVDALKRWTWRSSIPEGTQNAELKNEALRLARELSVEMKNLEAVTYWANQQLHAALGAGGEPPEDLLDRALASMERLNEAADTMMRLLGELLESA
jgi:hypothetical protein